MPSTIPILRERRKRRIAKQHKDEARTRNTLLSAGMILSLLIAALNEKDLTVQNRASWALEGITGEALGPDPGRWKEWLSIH